ncbi:uncharacterized protein EI97DRAFT_443386 [Westerdykella ornata]|uniref:Uncharacterized protein n=1 Tax=Westerdykella ornata TaxID=318751 RepID=A0A6A6JHL6_WESOR|nr:uncharacterized protein EI97DRAFT_443386 [Westerdykella ornata]KAF2275136.1 hypothetical protein EI97DRAFT_443386 [Westerdykella ornata]
MPRMLSRGAEKACDRKALGGCAALVEWSNYGGPSTSPRDPPLPRMGCPKASRNQVFPYFGHPVLVFRTDEAAGVLHFLPIVSLRGDTLQMQRQIAPKLIWPCFILIDECWDEEDREAVQGDNDYAAFPIAHLDRLSFRTKVKHWVVLDKVWRVEKRYLTVYPLPSPSQQAWSLPNPRCFLRRESLDAIRSYILYYESHRPCIEPISPQSFTFPRIRPQVGNIYRLPLATNNIYLNQAQSYSFYERPLGKPFLVTAVNVRIGGKATDGSVRAVKGFMITNFHTQPIRMHLGIDDARTRWIRYQYLPIEGPGVERHDDLPAIPLAPGSPRFAHTWYVHVLKQYRVEEGEILSWVADGAEEVRVAPETVRGLVAWHQALKSGRAREDYDERRWIVQASGMVGQPLLVGPPADGSFQGTTEGGSDDSESPPLTSGFDL